MDKIQEEIINPPEIIEPPYFLRSGQISKITEALSKAQGSIEEIVKDQTATVLTKAGGTYTYDYLGLPGLIKLIKKPMSDNGLALVFSASAINGVPVTIGLLTHTSGEWIRVTCPIFMDDKKMQSLGSAKTYSRRYIIQDLFNISADEDDDGNKASGLQASINQKPKPTLSQPQPTQQPKPIVNHAANIQRGPAK